MVIAKKLLVLFLLITISILNISKYTYPINSADMPPINSPHQPYSISKIISNAKPGSTIYVGKGVYYEHIIINKPLKIIGEGYPIIDGRGKGTVITIINTKNVLIKGLIIRNSGQSYSTEDSGIKIVNSTNIEIVGNRIENVFFGILPKDSINISIFNNYIESYSYLPVTEREHAVYAWYSHYIYIVNNTFSYVKDGVYNDHVYNAVIEFNKIKNARYGVHLMYCENITIIKNNITKSIAGLVLMYSENIYAYKNNVVMNRVGGIGEGIFIIEDDNIIIDGNYIIGNFVGINIRKTPYEPITEAIVRNNLIAFNYIGIAIDADSVINIYGNSFIENIRDISLIGFGIGLNKWYDENNKRGNFWSDFHSYDYDNDGIIDEPYVSQDILEDLMDGYPQLRIFLYSPAYLILEVMKKSFPINPRIKAVDVYPLASSPHKINAKYNISYVNILFTSFLTVIPMIIIVFMRRRL